MSSQNVPSRLPEEPFEKLKDVDDEEKTESDILPDVRNDDLDAQIHEEEGRPASLELVRTTSKALSKVSTRLANRHIVDPGPPPGKQPPL